MKVNYKEKTVLEEIDRVIKEDTGIDAIDYIELDYLEMGEFLEALDVTGREHRKVNSFDEVYYVYKGVRIYEAH